ncbi:DNA-binding protein [Micrococcus sp. ACRRV]|uniref:CT398-like coiled coil hairpin domain-containing protein n=1 Tax=Micrococcus sp. ACRRV TaxID=2918203 RepID=UPI001EF2C727|nr:DNA-binding protein [Micrococcus sp. ACRRV]MCG7422314.1 DNA-binding protein [Micrococcus sp. ACRRV]
MNRVTAPAAEQARLLELQQLDLGIGRAKTRLAQLRADAALADLQKAVAAAEEAAAEQEAHGRETDAAAAQASERATTTRARRDRTRAHLDAGDGGSKELTALQHELEGLESLLAEHEGAALAAMEAADEAEEALARARAAVDEARAAVAARADEVRAEGRRVTEEGRELAALRAGLAGRLPADLLARYEEARAANAGIGATRLEGRRTGAGTELSPADLDAVLATPADEVAVDPETGILIIRA